jgi:hypothetical protein
VHVVLVHVTGSRGDGLVVEQADEVAPARRATELRTEEGTLAIGSSSGTG